MAAIDKVLVTADAITTAYNSFTTCDHEVEDAILRMADACQTLSGSWRGAASDAFEHAFLELKKNLQTSHNSMDKILTELKNTQADYEGNETTLAALLEAMEDVTDPFANG